VDISPAARIDLSGNVPTLVGIWSNLRATWTPIPTAPELQGSDEI
jgi:hypothetical protein